MSLTFSLRTSASALTAHRVRLDVIASNIANMSTTRTSEGGPYRRRQTLLSAPSLGQASLNSGMRSLTPVGVRVAGIAERDSVRWAHDPTHPDADEEGQVAYPDIDLVEEMADMMSAVRAYEASVAAASAAKGMAMKALELGRG